jgi:hypothetical protein
MDNDIPYLREAYGLLADERVAAFVVRGHPALSEPDWLMREHFPLSEEPALTYGDVRVYLHPHLLAPGLAALENGQHPDLKINPDYLPPPDDLGARIRSFADLLEVEQEALRMISPRPSHVRAQFGLSLTTDESNATVLNAHPDVRFVFALPDGKQLVSARVKIRDSAYSEKSAKTPEIDGVEIAVREQRQDDDTITL